ncbi:hypothetical protein QE401_004127 [Pseudoroseomonas cervicalis]|nr:hypothetical protein [Pseudoroseomonas cervicalis]MDQ1081601.1 hypothetical protein [Pseudoroseomonas cervicalis]
MRTAPAASPLASMASRSAAPISAAAPPKRAASRSPAGVGLTLRVVRWSSCRPSRASKRRIVSLSAERETRSWRAAATKLPCSMMQRSDCRSA